MPSRAVLKKKARREAKRQRQAEPTAEEKPSVYYNGNIDSTEPPAARRQRMEAEKSRTYSGGSYDNASKTSSSSATIVPPRFQVPPPPKREPKPVPQAISKPSPVEGTEAVSNQDAADAVSAEAEGLTHKQKKKLQAKLRLEKQMARLQENAARAAAAAPAATEDQRGTESGEVSDDAEGGESEAKAPPAKPTEPPMRHDPRFTNGTFWRDRKERRARTLFLGGLPSRFTVQHVKDFVSTVVDTDPGAVDYIAQLAPGTPLVEDVDMLPDKHSGKVRHMYITMASVPIAFIASTKLDGMRMEQRNLRCNFAADKSQRAEAIKRRGPPEGRQAGGGGRRGVGRGRGSRDSFRGGYDGSRGRGRARSFGAEERNASPLQKQHE